MIINEHIKRYIRFSHIAQFGSWRLKVYTISSKEEIDSSYLETALRCAELEISEYERDDHYAVGFVTIHIAEQFNQIIIDWWANENELRHQVYKSTPGNKQDFTKITASGEAFCIWELRVIGFEREAWLEHVIHANPLLSNEIEEAYLSEELYSLDIGSV